MTSSLPAPLTAGDCDLSHTPMPIDFMIEMAVAQFGITAQQAEIMIREAAVMTGTVLKEVGHD